MIDQEGNSLSVSPERSREHTAKIIGGGVTGLSFGLELLKKGFEVEIFDPRLTPLSQGDRPDTGPSPMAVGQCLPFIPEGSTQEEIETIREMTKRSKKFYEELAQNPHETGVMSVTSYELLPDSADNEGHSDLPLVLMDIFGAEQMVLNSPINIPQTGKTYTHGYRFKTFSINTPKTLEYLEKQVIENGGKITPKKVDDVDRLKADGSLVVVVAGTGSKDFGLPDAQDINETKGHTYIVKPSDKSTESKSIPPIIVFADDLGLSVREDGTIVVGAGWWERDKSQDDPHNDLPLKREFEYLSEGIKPIINYSFDGQTPLSHFMDEGEIQVHRAGFRSIAPKGYIVNYNQADNVMAAYGFAASGWSLAPGAASLGVEKMLKSSSD